MKFQTTSQSKIVNNGREYKRLGYLYKPGTFEDYGTVYVDQDLIFHVSMHNGTVIRYRYLHHITNIFHKQFEFIAS